MTRMLFLFFWLLISNIILGQNKPDLYTQTSEMNDIMIRYNADRGSIARFYGTGDGWSNQVGFNTPELRDRFLQLITSYLKEMQQQDFESMNINGKVDYILFKSKLEDQQYQLQKETAMYQQVAPYIPFYNKVIEMVTPRRRGITVKGQEVARNMDAMRKEVIALTKKFTEISALEKEQATLASGTIKALQGLLKNYYTFYKGYNADFSWWVPKTYLGLDTALTDYATIITKKIKLSASQKDDGSGIIGNPIGREELIRQLKLEFIPYTPDELVEIANKEFAWCDAELLKASKEMGFGNNWKAAQEKVKNSFVPVGQQPEAMLELYNQSIDFLKKNDLVTIPPIAEETWRMIMMSPQQQLISPFFLGGETLMIAYPTDEMAYDDKLMSMRGNNPHFSRATVHHELIAGHHLQWFMKDRYKSYRNFETPFWHEGNAVYWEMLLWDLNFPRGPEDRIGMLFWRMHRCARIIFSLNYHLGKWTPQQCIDFLVDRVGHERANAEGEVRRSFTGNYGPLYQIAYMIGALQFTALKKELVDTKKMTYKQYHDAILHENSMPVEMLRVLLTQQKISRDFTTHWRFYNK